MLRSGPQTPELVLYKGCKGLTLSNGALEANNTGKNAESVRANVKVGSGRWYYEVKLASSGNIALGWATEAFAPNVDKSETVGHDGASWSYDGSRQQKFHAGGSSYGEGWSTGDVIGVALDLVARTLSFYRNGKDLGVAFTEISIGPGLVPAATLAQRQRCTFNFGKTPFAHPPPLGFFPLYSPITDADKAQLIKLHDKYKVVGKPLNASSDADVIRPEGTLQLGEDLGVTDVTDPLLLVLCFKLGAKTLWQFSADEFIGGFSRYGLGTLEQIKKQARQWQADLFRRPSPPEFKQFYFWTFDYLKEDKKILAVDEAVLIWGMLFKHRWPLLDKWLAFVKDSGMKAASRDTWQQLYEFSEQNQADVKSYDPDSSWPVAIDEFVEWLKKH